MDASANNLSSLMFNTISARTNTNMSIIALVTVFFAPLTFLCGYFGMNFTDFPGIHHNETYFWIISIPTTVVFIGLVGGGVGYRVVKAWAARFHLARARRERKERSARIRARQR